MKTLLVLDLDETLIHSMYPSQVEKAIDSGDMVNEFDYDYKILDYFITIERPHVHTFLKWAFEEFDVGIWTSASKGYADAIVENLIHSKNYGKPVFVYTCDNCVESRIGYSSIYGNENLVEYIKDLKKLKKFGYPLSTTLAVDDTPSKFKRQYGNLIKIPPFHGDCNDSYLLLLMQYLKFLKQSKDVRKIEKRHWTTTDPKYWKCLQN